jgi:hypothetical protein
VQSGVDWAAHYNEAAESTYSGSAYTSVTGTPKCLNGGTCSHGIGTSEHSCTCATGWTGTSCETQIVYESDFGSANAVSGVFDGWDCGGVQDCNEYGVICGGQPWKGKDTTIEKTVTVEAAGTYSLSMNLIALDTWDGETATVSINGAECWSRNISYNSGINGVAVGHGIGGDGYTAGAMRHGDTSILNCPTHSSLGNDRKDGQYTVTCDGIEVSGTELSIKIESNLDQNIEDESFGITDVVVLKSISSYPLIPVQSASMSRPNSRHPGSSCIDGNFDNYCHSSRGKSTTDPDDNTLVLDLGSAHEVRQVIIWNRGSNSIVGRRLGAHIIETSTDNDSWASCFTGTLPSTNGPFYEPCVASSAQYIRIRMDGHTDFINLNEVQVRGAQL